jgi:hypothetical protein
LRKALEEYEALVAKGNVAEQELARILSKHWYILDVTADRVLSKRPLGHEYEVDFLIQGPGNRYTIVEFKKPDANMFTKKGVETKTLRLTGHKWKNTNVGLWSI